MNSMDWLAYFRQNRLDRMPVAWDVPAKVPAAVRGTLAKSLGGSNLVRVRMDEGYGG